MNKDFWKTENIFVIFCLFWGLLFLVINPPFQASDEPEHMFKMYGFTQGTLNFQTLTIKGKKSSGLVLPKSLSSISHPARRLFIHPERKTNLSETKTLSNIPLSPQIKEFKAFAIPAYNPVAYFPNFIVLWIMKLLNLAPLSMMYILRFCTLLTYLAMVYYAIKITPVKKWLFFSAAVVPQAIYFASAINIDAIVTGYAFLATAYCLFLIFDKSVEKITKKQMFILGLFLTLVNLCKFPYFVMCFLLFTIPKEKFSEQKTRIIFILSVFLLNIFIDFITLFSHFLLIKGLGTQDTASNLPTLQMVNIVLKNQMMYFKFLFANFILGGYYYLQGLFAHFGWSDTIVPSWVIYTYFILLSFTGILNDKTEPEVKLSFKQKLILFLIFILMTLITAFTCFVLLAEIGPNGISIYRGKLFQGRYWIPLMPIIFLLFNSCITRFDLKWFKILTIGVFNLLMFICSIIILARYYI